MSIETIIGIAGVITNSVVAYHVYILSKKESFKERLVGRETIQKKLDELVHKIRNGNSSKVEIVNVEKYDTDYPHNNRYNLNGYTYLGAELKGYHYEGVEFITQIISGYQSKDGTYSTEEATTSTEVNIFVTGTIPYEWIEYIDITGDDTVYKPQFYTHFFGEEKYPYKKLRYYIKDSGDNFKEIKM